MLFPRFMICPSTTTTGGTTRSPHRLLRFRGAINVGGDIGPVVIFASSIDEFSIVSTIDLDSIM